MPPSPLPTFFFSYARRDDEKKPAGKMEQFFSDLQDTLRQRLRGVARTTLLGTFDRRIKHGSDWDDALSAGLRGNKAMVLVASPGYFDSDNCGKELAVFARRHSAARVDRNGRLRHTTNILQIRWLDDAGYEHNTVPDSLIPPVLRKLNWEPEIGAAALRRYKKGMQLCIKPGRDYYVELLRALADSIKNMPELPEAVFVVSWDDVRSAYDPKWAEDLNKPAAGKKEEEEEEDKEVESTAVLTTPAGPGNVAVFYLTRQELFFDSRTVDFAARLVDEPGWRRSSAPPDDRSYLALLQAVQQATRLEHLNDFHCACDPQVPEKSDTLIQQLAALTARNVLVAIALDPALWLGASESDKRARKVIDEVLDSDRWAGPVLLPIADANQQKAVSDAIAARKQNSRLFVELPGDTAARTQAVRSALLRERGRIMTASTTGTTDDRPPLLHGPGTKPD